LHFYFRGIIQIEPERIEPDVNALLTISSSD